MTAPTACWGLGRGCRPEDGNSISVTWKGPAECILHSAGPFPSTVGVGAICRTVMTMAASNSWRNPGPGQSKLPTFTGNSQTSASRMRGRGSPRGPPGNSGPGKSSTVVLDSESRASSSHGHRLPIPALTRSQWARDRAAGGHRDSGRRSDSDRDDWNLAAC